jgi:hypothetical protein
MNGSAKPSMAMKVYDYQWSATFGLDACTAATELARDGIDTVLIRNQIDPLPNSGVDQKAYLASDGNASESADREWSDALRGEGMRVYQTTALFFDPELVALFPDARPVAANGRPSEGFDWYLGVCPTHEAYLAVKIDRLRRVVAELEPDGLFLSFTRYPGFWENWVPTFQFSDADRFCFCERCRGRFAEEQGIDLPSDAVAAAQAILGEHGSAWTTWRSARVIEAIERIGAAVRAERSGLPLMLNTLPFPASDFGGLDARREIAAQDLRRLRGVIDRFELMTYLQILDRPDSWLYPVLEDARGDVSDRPLLCTLQVAPLYTEGVHAGWGRGTEITSEALERTAQTALAAGADGLVFYHWTDFLVDEAEGGRKRDVLRGLARA